MNDSLVTCEKLVCVERRGKAGKCMRFRKRIADERCGRVMEEAEDNIESRQNMVERGEVQGWNREKVKLTRYGEWKSRIKRETEDRWLLQKEKGEPRSGCGLKVMAG